MKKNILFAGILPAVVLLLFFSSCKKHETDSNVISAGDEAFAQSMFNDAVNIADEAGISGSVSAYRTAPAINILSACATVTVFALNSADQDTLFISFGNTDCTCNDGRNRRGEIIVYYSGNYTDSAAVHTFSFDNYFVNDNQVRGTIAVTNLGHISAGNLVYDLQADGSIVLATNSGAGTITWTAHLQRTWVQGESTPLNWNDDVYAVTGTGSGRASDGYNYTVNITSPLLRNMTPGCKAHFVQGKFDLTPENKAVRSVDFGNGDCDDLAMVTIDGNSYQVHLR